MGSGNKLILKHLNIVPDHLLKTQTLLEQLMISRWHVSVRKWKHGLEISIGMWPNRRSSLSTPTTYLS